MTGTVVRLLILVLLGSWQYGAVAAEAVAKVVAVSGDVQIVRVSDGEKHPLLFKDPVYLNDHIVTAEASMAKLLLGDDSILKVSPTSDIHISQLLVGPGEQSNTTVNLLKGKLRALIGKKLGANSRFEVHTDVAVAGVRGTDFEVLVVAGETFVRCFSGVVRVGNIDPNVRGYVVLRANMYTRVLEGTLPETPLYIAPGESLSGKHKQEGAGGENNGMAKDQEGSVGEYDELVTAEVLSLQARQTDILTPSGEEFGPVGAYSPDRLPLFESVLEKEIYGDAVGGQVDIVNKPISGGVNVPVEITFPSP